MGLEDEAQFFPPDPLEIESGGQPSSVPAIRADSILTFAGLEKVIVPEGGKAVEKQVTTGRRAAGLVEIKDGIGVGDGTRRSREPADRPAGSQWRARSGG